MKKNILALLLLFGVSGFGCAHSGTSFAGFESKVPIQKVVLYKNGVGFFERRGKIEEDVLQLQVKPNQINDILKSLTVIDLNQGKVVSVGLPLEATQALRFTEFPNQIQNNAGMFRLLQSLRGADVKIEGRAGNIGGRILGMEEVPVVSGVNSWRIALRDESGALVNYPYKDVRKVFLENKALRVGIEKSLDWSLNQDSWRPVKLSIQLRGKQPHDLLISYISEMPIWKPAYRLVLDEEKSLLQGWAVVDNISGEDWKNVQLSLVAGNPLTFIYDLHSPQYTERVDLTPKHQTQAEAPTAEISGYVEESEMQMEEGRARGGLSLRRAAKKTRQPPRPSVQPMAGFHADSIHEIQSVSEDSSLTIDSLRDQFSAQAEGTKMGALFRYDLKEPVTILDRTSTLVSTVNQDIEGKEVVLFQSEGQRIGNQQNSPYRAVLLNNTTGLTLEQGPMTIYARGALVGEGFIQRMDQGASNFITFAKDEQVWMTAKISHGEQASRLLKIVDGLIETEVLQTEKTKFEIENKHSKTMTAYVKMDRKQGWTLKNKPNKTVETPNALFLPIEIDAKKKKQWTAEWVLPTKRTISVNTAMSAEVLSLFLADGKVPPSVEKPLKEILKIKQTTTEKQKETSRVQTIQNQLESDQRRVRDNLNLLRKTKGNAKLQKELTQKLANLENELGKLSSQRVRLSEEIAQLQNQITFLIRQISFENKEK